MSDKFAANQSLLEKLERGLDAKRKCSDCEDMLSLTDEDHKKNSERFQKRKNQIKKARKKAKKHLEQFTPLDDDAEFDFCNHNNEDKVIETTGVVKEEDASVAKTLSYTEKYRAGALTFGVAGNAAEETSSACVTPITQIEASQSNSTPAFDGTTPVFTAPDIPDTAADAIVTSEEFVKIKTDPMAYAQEARLHIRLACYKDEHYAYFNGVYNYISEKKIGGEVFKLFRSDIIKLGSPELVGRIVRCILIMLSAEPERTLDEAKNYVVLLNCRLNLLTRSVEPHSPDLFEVIQLQVNYDPTAKRCPVFKSFLRTISGGDPRIEVLIKEMMAYCLTPDTKAKCLFVCYGESNCGKSVLINLVRSFFPKLGISAIALQDMGEKFSSGTLSMSRLNIDADLPDKIIGDNEVSLIKKYTGHDEIPNNRKYIQTKDVFVAAFKMLFATNHKLVLKSADDAFLKRLIFIPFLYSVPEDEQDPNLLDKLKEERSAIFNEIMPYYVRLVENDYKFSVCVDPADYCETRNVNTCTNAPAAMDDFFNSTVIVTGDDSDFVSTEQLVKKFTDYCKEHGYNRLVSGASNRIGSYICAKYKGIVTNARPTVNGRSLRGYKGISLCDD